MTRHQLYMSANGLSADEIVGATALSCERDLRGLTGGGEYAMAGYCSQLTVDRCSNCSLCNYGRDCHNHDVAI